MNRENIQKVRDHIATLPPERLFMNRVIAYGRDVSEVSWTAGRLLKDCGTCGCVAGWTAAILAPRSRYEGAEKKAAGLLGLSALEATRLFYPDVDRQWHNIVPADAVRVLDHLLETGEVDWSIIDTVTV